MGKMSLPYVEENRKTVNGKSYVYYFYRREGKRFRLPHMMSPEFSHVYDRIDKAFKNDDDIQIFPPGSLGQLIVDYKETSAFKQLVKKSRAYYRRYLDELAEKNGHIPAKKITRDALYNYLEKFAATPRTANQRGQVIRRLFSFAVDRKQATYGIRENPLARMDRMKEGPGHRPAEEFEIEEFRRQHPLGTRKRTAFEIALNTGQRGGDVVAMMRHHRQGGEIFVAQDKGSERLWIPESADLTEALDAYLRTHDSLMILASEKGGSQLSTDTFRHEMREAYDEAALPKDFTTHGLRYAAATRIRELGCDWEDIGAITGHTTASMARKYSRQKRRAKLVVAKIDSATRNKK